MSIGSALAIFFILWWLVFFAVLPFGVRTQEEAGDVEPGSVPSAPAQPRLLLKAAATTLVAGVIFTGLYALWSAGYRIDSLPIFR